MTYDPNRPTTPGSTERQIDSTANAAHGAVDSAAQAAQSAVDRVQQVGSQVADKAQQMGNQVSDTAQQVVNRADAATTTVGERMTDMAQTLRERAPTTGTVGNVADTAANTLERAGSYLQQQDLSDMRSDLEGLIRRYPVQSLLVGLGIGYLLARSTRR